MTSLQKNVWLAQSAHKVQASRDSEYVLDIDLHQPSGTIVSVNHNVVPLLDTEDEFIGLL